MASQRRSKARQDAHWPGRARLDEPSTPRRHRISPTSIALPALAILVLAMVAGAVLALARGACDGAECGQHATCQLDRDEQPVCVCQPGYLVPSEGPLTCTDVNECLTGITITVGGQVVNGSRACGDNALCTNRPGSFECQCPAGFAGNPYKQCLPSSLAAPAASLHQSSPAAIARAQHSQLAAPSSTPKPPNFRRRRPQESTRAPNTSTSTSASTRAPSTSTSAPSTSSTSARPRFRLATSGRPQRLSAAPYTLQRAQPAPSSAPVTPVRFLRKQSKPTTISPVPKPAVQPDVQQQPEVQQQHQEIQQQHQEIQQQHQEIQQQHQEIQQQHQEIQQQRQEIQQQRQEPVVQHQERLSFANQTISENQVYELQREPVQVRTTGQLVTYELPLAIQFEQTGPVQVVRSSSVVEASEQHNFSSASERHRFEATHLAPPPPAQVQQIDADGFEHQQQQKEQLVLVPQVQVQVSQQEQQQQQQQEVTLVSEQQQHKQQDLRVVHIEVPVEVPQVQLQRIQTTVKQEQHQETSQQQQEQRRQEASQQQQNLQVVVQPALEIRLQPAQQKVVSSVSSASSASSATNTSELQSNRSTSFDFRRVACAHSAQCPGNLHCLAGGLCGCPSGLQREADYCYLRRVHCASAALCRAREECVSAKLIQQYYESYLANSSEWSNSSSSSSSARQQQVEEIIRQQDEYVGICVCPRGFRLAAAGLACMDANECAEGRPCGPGAECRNRIGSFECLCPPGTHGEPYTTGCVRYECLQHADCAAELHCDLVAHRCVSPCLTCGPRAACQVAQHVAVCSCPPRFVGNAIDLVYGCQPAPTTTSTSTTTTTTTTTTTSTTTTTTPPPPETSTPETRTVPPSELLVTCRADGVQVRLEPAGVDGLAYVRGHSREPQCRRPLAATDQEPAELLVPFGACGLVPERGEAAFTLVVQRHAQLVTSRARAYQVRCLYEGGERGVDLALNVSAVSRTGTIANTGPPPSLVMSITALNGTEVAGAEIGQELLLRLDVQPDNIYGAFAHSCQALTDELEPASAQTIQVTDERGCATDPAVFGDWRAEPAGPLAATFSAFRFPASSALSFQCRVKVCFGPCPAVNCAGVDAPGARVRRQAAEVEGEPATRRPAAREPDAPEPADPPDESALREDILVRSNTIRTLEPKGARLLADQSQPQVQDIELVCLPWLGLLLSALIALLLAALALCLALSCWRAGRRQPAKPAAGPLPHPAHIPNPMRCPPAGHAH